MCSKEFEKLCNRPSLSWICYKCNSINVSSFNFHHYELTSPNTYEPLSDLEVSPIPDQSNFNPTYFSSPTSNSNLKQRLFSNRTNSDSTIYSRSENSTQLLPPKTNLRIMTANCRSIFDKKSELEIAIDYSKPDVIIGTESWLRGIKPGQPIGKSAIKNCEVFPDHYQVFRNDRDDRGGGVFIAINKMISAVEQAEIVTNCELAWAKLSLKRAPDLHVAASYMPYRNSDVITQLDESLTKLNSGKAKHILLAGDFNCPGINWDTNTTTENCQDKKIQEHLIEVSNNHNLTQIHREPTRQNNLLDLVFTSNPTLVKSSTNIPGISDHDIVITDFDIKPRYQRQPKRKIYKYNKADWKSINDDMEKLSRDL